MKAYFGSGIDLPSFVKRLVKYATEKEDSRKNGVSVIADMGSFYLMGQTDKVVDYERSLPSKFDINMKGFCCYHQKDFNRLTEHQKQILTKVHGKNLVALECG